MDAFSVQTLLTSLWYGHKESWSGLGWGLNPRALQLSLCSGAVLSFPSKSPLFPWSSSLHCCPVNLSLCFSHCRSNTFHLLPDSWSLRVPTIRHLHLCISSLPGLKDPFHRRDSKAHNGNQNKRITVFTSKPNKSAVFIFSCPFCSPRT